MKKISSQPTLVCRYFLHIFTKCVSKVRHVSIHKQSTTFRNNFGILSPLCQGKG
jgi:hypothetical protein